MGSEERQSDSVKSVRMAGQRRRDTEPEVSLRRALHARGFRYRVDAPVPGLPRRRTDIAFMGAQVAVFVDGCFWHCCPDHRTWPRANGLWWAEKLRRNVERDQETNQHLASLGWIVVRVWEHEDLETAVDRVVRVLLGRQNPT